MLPLAWVEESQWLGSSALMDGEAAGSEKLEELAEVKRRSRDGNREVVRTAAVEQSMGLAEIPDAERRSGSRSLSPGLGKSA